MDKTAPTLTVIVETYNHREYIIEALESVCAQKTCFSFDIVLIDDFSTDGTSRLVDDFILSSKIPVKLVRPSENKNNLCAFATAVNNCSSQYIALLDGDDYWTSSSKLQTQFDILQANPSWVLCCHNVLAVYQNESITQRIKYRIGEIPRVTTIKNLWDGCYPQTVSVVFRRDVFDELPDWYFQSVFGDWELFLFLAQFGEIGYLEDVMGVYRVHGGGVWSRLSSEAQADQMLRSWRHIREECSDIFDRYAEQRMHYRAAHLYLDKNMLRKSLSHFIYFFGFLDLDLFHRCQDTYKYLVRMLKMLKKSD